MCVSVCLMQKPWLAKQLGPKEEGSFYLKSSAEEVGAMYMMSVILLQKTGAHMLM